MQDTAVLIPKWVMSASCPHRTRTGLSGDIRSETILGIANLVLVLLISATTGAPWPPPGFVWVLVAGAVGCVVRGGLGFAARRWLDRANAWVSLAEHPKTARERWIERTTLSPRVFWALLSLAALGAVLFVSHLASR
jgi:hypothetical protein